MWLASKFGFYSIVKDSKSSNFQVRARCGKDLENICNNVPVLKGKRIIFTINSDYSHRIFITEEELQVLMVFMAVNLDYTNFKDKIKTIKDKKEKVPYYFKIWNAMWNFQMDKEDKIFKSKRYKNFYE